MWVFRELEGYVYKNNSKQIFIPLHYPDILGSKERKRESMCMCILCLEAANSNENSPPAGREITHSFS